MYNDNNNYQNSYSFSTDPNQNGGQGYQGYQGQPVFQYTPSPEPPRKKKVSGGLIVGLLILAVAVGGMSGFGGSYIANRLDGEDDNRPSTSSTAPAPAETDNSGNIESTEPEITAPEIIRPESGISDDLSTLANTAAMNTTEKYDYEKLYAKINESIVMVYNYVSDGYGGFTKSGTGSGVIFTTDGYIITNHHVVEGASKITVVVSDKATNYEDIEMEAAKIGTDKTTDIAVLKVEREEKFVASAIGDSDSLKVGQEVCVIGNPSGLFKSLSNGIVSGLNRFSNDEGYALSSIQTNAAINPGNSGGGLFDMYGNLVGVVNSKFVATSGGTSIENLGFAITINEAKPIISDLINYGYITGRPMIGISTREVGTGILVAEIDPDAPVSESDLRIGDIITAINGESVATVTDVQRITKGMKGGDKVTLTVSRPTTTGNGYFAHTTYETMEIEVVLTENKGS